jgi:hypothetical protein
MKDNDLLMIILAFVFGFILLGMMKNMCGGLLIEGVVGDTVDANKSLCQPSTAAKDKFDDDGWGGKKLWDQRCADTQIRPSTGGTERGGVLERGFTSDGESIDKELSCTYTWWDGVNLQNGTAESLCKYGSPNHGSPNPKQCKNSVGFGVPKALYQRCTSIHQPCDDDSNCEDAWRNLICIKNPNIGSGKYCAPPTD